MIYRSGLVAAVKCNKKVLREREGSVTLPFGSEYSLLIKNIQNLRAEVGITIDGQDVMGGRKLIVNSNSEVELERFVDNLSSGRKFKFIERTEDIENYRGVKVCDGLIRVEYAYERIPDLTTKAHYETWKYNRTDTPYFGIDYNMFTTCNSGESVVRTRSVSSNDVGITVHGSESLQQFSESVGFPTESTSHVIILQLKGHTADNVPVTKPLTVKTKRTCPSCGTKWNSKFEYCAKDGTYLG
jgi:hypothetical protein